MFKKYTRCKDVPTYKGMQIRENVPFIMTLDESIKFYYIIKKVNKKYIVRVFDEECMLYIRAGYIRDDKDNKYQTDKHTFDTKNEIYAFLNSTGFSNDNLKSLKKLLNKPKMYLAEDIYLFSESDDTLVSKSDVSIYMEKGTRVKLKDGLYYSKEGSSAPEEICKIKIK